MNNGATAALRGPFFRHQYAAHFAAGRRRRRARRKLDAKLLRVKLNTWAPLCAAVPHPAG